MAEPDLRLVAVYERELDTGLKRCLDVSREMQRDLPKSMGGRLSSDGSHEARELALEPWTRKFYKIIAVTLFRVLRIMQPGDFQNGAVNFYVWPGYYSSFTYARLFYRSPRTAESTDRARNLGVGLFGDPAGSSFAEYHECCQTEWYDRATTHSLDGFYPGSPYHWFMKQQPKAAERPDELLQSLTFTTAPDWFGDSDFPEHRVRNLTAIGGDSSFWGNEFSATLNELIRDHPDWIFPDRIDRQAYPDFQARKEQDLRELRNVVISLWMHSVFRQDPPDWMANAILAARSHGFEVLAMRLVNGLVDPTASDWGDKTSGRSQFTTWTTLMLDPLVAPPLSAVVGPMRQSGPGRIHPDDQSRNIGWVTVLSSVPLRTPFLHVARRWIRTVYGTLRHSEISLLHNDQKDLVTASLAASHVFHDIHKFIEESLDTIVREARECSESAAGYREFIGHALQALSGMVDALCSAVPNHAKRERLAESFIESLSHPDIILKATLLRVANDVQEYRKRPGCATVDLEQSAPLSEVTKLSGSKTYVSCLLLTGEIIRNYVQHGPTGKHATWSSAIIDGRLIITLSGAVKQDADSHTFCLLHNYLQLLGVGTATSDWVDPAQRIKRWRVEVELPRKETKE